MRENTIHLLYPILLVLQTITSGAVDGPLFKVEVTAVDSAGQPIQGAEVEVTDQATTNYIEGHFAQGLTDEKGQCRLSLRALRLSAASYSPITSIPRRTPGTLNSIRNET